MPETASADEYTPAQLYKMAAVYDLIARLLPTEGRDYSVEFAFKENDQVSIKMTHYTEFGKVWCDYCNRMLRHAAERLAK